MKSIITIFALLSLVGCATAPMAPVEKDIEAKRFEPKPDTAAMYIYRNENFGGAISMDVSVNGRTIGQTAAKTYFKLDLLPGSYHVESRAENTSAVDVAVQAGQNYFIWQEVKLGIISARSKLHAVADAIGKSGVLESRLIASVISHQTLASGSPAADSSNISDRLAELKALRDKNEITQSEYDQAKTKLLGEF